MDLQESEQDEEEDQFINEEELVSFQKNLLRDDNIEVEDEEPEIEELPFQDYDLSYIDNWIKNNIENYQFQSHK